MVMSVNPIRCVTLARWLTRGMLNSVGWLPFLNCASAVLTSNPNPANPTNSPKTHFGISRMTVAILPRNCKLLGAPSRLYSWHIGRLLCGKVSLGKREFPAKRSLTDPWSDHAYPNRLALFFWILQPFFFCSFLGLQGLRQGCGLSADVLA